MTGIDLFSAGDFIGGEGSEEIVLSVPYGGVYKNFVIRDDRLVGACLYGDAADGAWYFDLVRQASDVSQYREQLMFGQHHLGDTGHAGNSRAAAMAERPRCAAATASTRAPSSGRSATRACSRSTR